MPSTPQNLSATQGLPKPKKGYIVAFLTDLGTLRHNGEPKIVAEKSHDRGGEGSSKSHGAGAPSLSEYSEFCSPSPSCSYLKSPAHSLGDTPKSTGTIDGHQLAAPRWDIKQILKDLKVFIKKL